MSGRRKICVVITARPSYSRIKTALIAIQQSNQLTLQLVVAGAALLERYGSIEATLEKDGFIIDEKVFMVLEGENPMSMAKTTGLGVIELANVFYKLQPDAVVVIADRFETIAVSVAAAYQNIPLVHIQGGEVTGNIDEKVRHANTKLADIHFVCSESARQRVLRLGEDASYVFNTGCPSIDLAAAVANEPQLNFNPYTNYGGVGQTPDYSNGYLVVMQHPVTTEYQLAKAQIFETLYAVKDLKITTFWFWPNIDAGADGISKGIRTFREEHDIPHIHFFKNMAPEDFLKILCNCICLIGNSSAGIRECSYLGVPAVNIGSRQDGRDRGLNVKDVTPVREAIYKAVTEVLSSQKPEPSYVYGGGEAGKHMADILTTIPLRFHKRITF